MTPVNTILIIIGITGDLSRRKLLPAIDKIISADAVAGQLKVLGVTRQPAPAGLPRHVEMHQMDLADPADYHALKRRLDELADGMGGHVQRIFYLSVPPQVARPVIQLLGEAGFATNRTTKLLIEKPFGTDLGSARELIDRIQQYFDETQVYRIDHYLAKEMAQNLLVFRHSNALFRHTWNTEFIKAIDVIASERIGIEGRAAFYEQTGALRDVVQSHLLQLAALVLAELPAAGGTGQVPGRRLAALQQLSVAGRPVRGQYRGYRQEVANPQSNVETYASLVLKSSDPRWQNTPIRLVTGKALHDKATVINVHYRADNPAEANVLTFRIQPNEGVDLCLWVKQPGYDRRVRRLPLQFDYHRHYETWPEAYEQVIVDAIASDRGLFTASAEVLESWRIIEPVQRRWELEEGGLVVYDEGATPEQIDAIQKPLQ